MVKFLFDFFLLELQRKKKGEMMRERDRNRKTERDNEREEVFSSFVYS